MSKHCSQHKTEHLKALHIQAFTFRTQCLALFTLFTWISHGSRATCPSAEVSMQHILAPIQATMGSGFLHWSHLKFQFHALVEHVWPFKHTTRGTQSSSCLNKARRELEANRNASRKCRQVTTVSIVHGLRNWEGTRIQTYLMNPPRMPYGGHECRLMPKAPIPWWVPSHHYMLC